MRLSSRAGLAQFLVVYLISRRWLGSLRASLSHPFPPSLGRGNHLFPGRISSMWRNKLSKHMATIDQTPSIAWPPSRKMLQRGVFVTSLQHFNLTSICNSSRSEELSCLTIHYANASDQRAFSAAYKLWVAARSPHHQYSAIQSLIRTPDRPRATRCSKTQPS